MKSEKKIGKKRGKEEQIPPEYNSLYYWTGTKSDIWDMIGIGIMYPLLLFIFLGYVTGKAWNLPMIFIVVDTLLFSAWGYLLRRDKKRMENGRTQEEIGREKRLEALYKKLEELDQEDEGKT